jgi:dUTP pyrophosphatase
MIELKIKRVHSDAKIPSYAHEGDAGMDIFAIERVEIKPGERLQLRTGLSLQFPNGYVALLWDKSGLSHKYGLKLLGCVIDAGYRGEMHVGIMNLGKETYIFEKGHKLCQMLIQPVIHPVINVVEELDQSERGTGGFGSSGK